MGYTNFSKDRFSKDNFTKINFIKTGGRNMCAEWNDLYGTFAG